MSKRWITAPEEYGTYALWCLEVDDHARQIVVRCSGTAVGTLPYRDDDTDEALGRMLGQFVLLLEQVTARRHGR